MNKRYKDQQGRAIPFYRSRFNRQGYVFYGCLHEIYPSGRAKLTTIKHDKRGRIIQKVKMVENHQEYVLSAEGRR